MPSVTYQGKIYECSSEESLLDGMNRQGANISYGCRGGLCQACMVKAVRGIPPAAAQAGIKSSLKEKGYFLACLCNPDTDFEISLPDRRDEFTQTTISSLERLTPTVIRMKAALPPGFAYRPGQFVNFIRASDGLSRSYSLASIPDDHALEFHIRLLPGGRMSEWIANELNVGDPLLLSDAMGDCCYRDTYADRSLLLAGTGTGLAPLYGILRDALARGHQQPIRLVHGGLSGEELYLDRQLRTLADEHDNVTYTPCVLNGAAPSGGLTGPIDTRLASQLVTGQNRAAFLCGDSAIVDAMRRACMAAGLNEPDIHSDTFG